MNINKLCPICNNIVEPDKFHPNKKYCNKKCRSISSSRRYRKKHIKKLREKWRKHPLYNTIKRKCIECSEIFSPTDRFHPTQKYCGKSCMRKVIDKRYANRHPDKIRRKWKNYRQTERGKQVHRDSVRPYTWVRRETIKQKGYHLSPKDQRFIRKRDNHQCVYCGDTKGPFHLDHIIPIKPVNKGGLNVIENLVLSCDKCNTSKQNRDVFNWCKDKNIKVPPKIIKLIKNQIKKGYIKPNYLNNLR